MLNKTLWFIAQAALLITLVASSLGCVEDIPEGPEDRCEYYIDTACSRHSRCGHGGKSSCVSQLRTVFNCSTAVGTSPQYEQCIEDFGSSSCAQLRTSNPATCMSVLFFR